MPVRYLHGDPMTAADRAALLHAPHWRDGRVALCLRVNALHISTVADQRADRRVTCPACLAALPRAARREGHSRRCRQMCCTLTPKEQHRLARCLWRWAERKVKALRTAAATGMVKHE